MTGLWIREPTKRKPVTDTEIPPFDRNGITVLPMLQIIRIQVLLKFTIFVKYKHLSNGRL